jgi:hypothetical protein
MARIWSNLSGPKISSRSLRQRSRYSEAAKAWIVAANMLAGLLVISSALLAAPYPNGRYPTLYS